MILDTNALSAFAEGTPEALARISSAQTIALPVLVLGEYRFGILQSRHRDKHEQWLAEVLPTFLTLDITEATTLHYAAIRLELKQAGAPIPTNDLWIAALCRQHQYALLSRDRHFDRIKDLQRVAW